MAAMAAAALMPMSKMLQLQQADFYHIYNI